MPKKYPKSIQDALSNNFKGLPLIPNLKRLGFREFDSSAKLLEKKIAAAAKLRPADPTLDNLIAKRQQLQNGIKEAVLEERVNAYCLQHKDVHPIYSAPDFKALCFELARQELVRLQEKNRGDKSQASTRNFIKKLIKTVEKSYKDIEYNKYLTNFITDANNNVKAFKRAHLIPAQNRATQSNNLIKRLQERSKGYADAIPKIERDIIQAENERDLINEKLSNLENQKKKIESSGGMLTRFGRKSPEKDNAAKVLKHVNYSIKLNTDKLDKLNDELDRYHANIKLLNQNLKAVGKELKSANSKLKSDLKNLSSAEKSFNSFMKNRIGLKGDMITQFADSGIVNAPTILANPAVHLSASKLKQFNSHFAEEYDHIKPGTTFKIKPHPPFTPKPQVPTQPKEFPEPPKKEYQEPTPKDFPQPSEPKVPTDALQTLPEPMILSSKGRFKHDEASTLLKEALKGPLNKRREFLQGKHTPRKK